MWKKIGIKSSKDLLPKGSEDAHTKKYKRVLPLQDTHPDPNYCRSESYNSLRIEQTLFSDETMIHLNGAMRRGVLSPRITSPNREREMISILKNKPVLECWSPNNILNEDSQMPDQQTRLLNSTSLRRFHCPTDNRNDSKVKSGNFKENKVTPKQCSFKANTDQIMDEIIKLRTQLKIAQETNKLYKTLVYQFKNSFQVLAQIIRQEIHAVFEQFSHQLLEVCKGFSIQRTNNFLVSQIDLSPVPGVNTPICSLTSPVRLPLVQAQHNSIHKIIGAVESIKSSILKRPGLGFSKSPKSRLGDRTTDNLENYCQIPYSVTFKNIDLVDSQMVLIDR